MKDNNVAQYYDMANSFYKLKAKLDKILLSRADITGDDMAKQLSPSNHYEPETNKTNENDKETEL
jgi:hypothetical protein